MTYIRGHRFPMQFIQCNNWLDVVHVFAFFWGARLWGPWYNFFYVRPRKVQHYINTVIEYGHFRLKICGISRLTLSQRESSPCSELYCSQLPTFSKSSSMIDCLFGEVVRFYFIVLRPLWSASRCRLFMTVAYPLNKQSLQCHQHLVVWGRIQSSLICAVGSQDVFIWLFIGQVRTVTDKRFWRYTCPSDKW